MDRKEIVMALFIILALILSWMLLGLSATLVILASCAILALPFLAAYWIVSVVGLWGLVAIAFLLFMLVAWGARSLWEEIGEW